MGVYYKPKEPTIVPDGFVTSPDAAKRGTARASYQLQLLRSDTR
ncbi:MULTISPECIES: hypothetical protein [unclassified Moorena]|nr:MULTISPECIES: hypothetical protein [unclassified Moorena]